jgi:hypothetical protein
VFLKGNLSTEEELQTLIAALLAVNEEFRRELDLMKVQLNERLKTTRQNLKSKR